MRFFGVCRRKGEGSSPFFSSFKKGGSIIAFCWLVYMTIRPKSWLPFFFPSAMAMCALITWQDHHPSAELSFFFFFFRFGKRRAIWTVSIDEFVIKGGTTTTILKFSNGPFYTLEWAALEWSAFFFSISPLDHRSEARAALNTWNRGLLQIEFK